MVSVKMRRYRVWRRSTKQRSRHSASRSASSQVTPACGSIERVSSYTWFLVSRTAESESRQIDAKITAFTCLPIYSPKHSQRFSRSMSITFSERLHSVLSGALRFVPAMLAFVGVAFVENSWSLALLLVADALTMIAVCRIAGFHRGATFLGDLLWRGSAYCVLVAGYTALLAALIGFPIIWLLREGSLGATLATSGAVVVALIVLWRWWPAFGLLLIWKKVDRPGAALARVSVAVRRSIAFAWNLTAENDLFFSHGLIVAV